MALRAASIAAIIAATIGLAISLAQFIDLSSDDPMAVDPRPTISPSRPTAVSPGASPVAVQRVEIVVIPGQPQDSDGPDRVSQFALLITAMGTLLAGIGALGALTAARRRNEPPPPTKGEASGAD
jgi:hypothetical protein